jgi:type 1 glutamine amidotransferase
MKNNILPALVALSMAVATISTTIAAPVKKVLVVTVTTGFRHSSIPTAEKVLAQLAKDSGEFTVDFVQQPSGKPANPKKDATPEEKDAFKAAEAQWEETLKTTLLKLSPDSLKNYDGVIFASTTGDLPLPDKQGFLDWIKAGHAFIGVHAASDTFHNWPEFIQMLGGEFLRHGPQVGVECVNQDPKNPATAQIGKSLMITQEEIYQFKNYEASKVHDLLSLEAHPNDKTPGHYPVSWCNTYGQGRVFYTSLGHREDIWDADPALPKRVNSVEISKAFQAHLLGGIEWALGLKDSGPAGASANASH